MLSFPGRYEKEWKRITRRKKVCTIDGHPLSIACVFFPDNESRLYGKHSRNCICDELYANNHPSYKDWPHGKAPWYVPLIPAICGWVCCLLDVTKYTRTYTHRGCLWFEPWKLNVEKACAFGMKTIVVYSEFMAGDAKGLGFSQRGEVALRI